MRTEFQARPVWVRTSGSRTPGGAGPAFRRRGRYNVSVSAAKHGDDGVGHDPGELWGVTRWKSVNSYRKNRALAPAVGSIKPPAPTGAGNRDAVEGRVAGQLVPEAVHAKGPGAIGVAPPVKASERTRASSSRV